MSLYERLQKARGESDATEVESSEETRLPDSVASLKRKVHQSLLQALGPKLYDVDLTAAELETRVRDKLAEVLSQEATPLSQADRKRLIVETIDDILGYGPIEPYLRDPSVTEVMVNGFANVYVEREGRITKTATRFIDDAHLRRTIEKIVGQVGRRIDESQPYVDARLSDGS
ncbi:MAG: ATPase, T2SS/T4P/T4SS family, partial [Acidimicrobiia bacterium]